MSEPVRLLYIDDDAGLRALAARRLGRMGFAVETAETGADGVAMAAAGRYDLIAVDHYMPGEDGLATLARLRDLPDLPPIVYVTGSEESRIAVAAMKAGAAEYVVKSIGEDFFDLFAEACRQALAHAALKAEMAAAEEALKASNQRLEALLREVNHRVSNSLQLVSAFIHMQARALTDEKAREALTETQQRIGAIREVHFRLYTSDDADSVDVPSYLTAIAEEIAKTWSTPQAPRTLTVACDPIRLSADTAISLGVIVTELVSNACKYAYAADAAGAVRVAVTADGDGHFTLAVEDDGRGLDGTVKGTGLGSRLIGTMAKSLKCEVAYATAANGTGTGVRATLRAPIG